MPLTPCRAAPSPKQTPAWTARKHPYLYDLLAAKQHIHPDPNHNRSRHLSPARPIAQTGLDSLPAMFSPEASVQSARGSLRNNPRRRQRKDSDGVQQPRRKRNKISEDTFYSPLDAHVNGNGGAVMNGRLSHGHGDADGSMVLVDMPVREKKAVVKRASKDDAAHYLVRL